MHRDMFKIQDGVAIVEKLNSSKRTSETPENVRRNKTKILLQRLAGGRNWPLQIVSQVWRAEFTVEETSSITKDRPCWLSDGENRHGIIGPLPTTENGNRFILVAIDYFSCWPEAYAIPNQQAPNVAES